MAQTEESSHPLKLSICITTHNRAHVIGETLDSILSQLTTECELVILDGASTDDTESIVSPYARRSPQLRYIRQSENGGFDRDMDRAVHLARGQYCWLMSDDDLLTQGAIAAVLSTLRSDYSVLIVNVEARTAAMSNLIVNRVLPIDADRVFAAEDIDGLFEGCRRLITYVGCVIIKRSLWLTRNRTSYYDSLFMHVGVIYQRPLPSAALIMQKTCISYRWTCAFWSSRWFETMMFKWPAVVHSLAISDAIKLATTPLDPWRRFSGLLFGRAIGAYTLAEYRSLVRPRLKRSRELLVPALVARLPGSVLRTLLIVYYTLRRDDTLRVRLEVLKQNSLRKYQRMNQGIPSSAQT